MCKRFFYFALGVFLLAVAYHLGAATSSAQSNAPQESIVARSFVVVGDDGRTKIILKSLGGASVMQFLSQCHC
jgi:hypothetical protein